MKKVLITGAAGFLGSHLCDRFIKEGFHVIAMDNLITGDLKNIEHLFKLEQFEFQHHDVTKFVHVPGKLDYILHFASPSFFNCEALTPASLKALRSQFDIFRMAATLTPLLMSSLIAVGEQPALSTSCSLTFPGKRPL
jgi:NAD(P)-dependent dehydrogenase (short-subunit alcohol dehydrogenase family)